MNKKILAITLVGIFLLTSFTTISATKTNNIKSEISNCPPTNVWITEYKIVDKWGERSGTKVKVKWCADSDDRDYAGLKYLYRKSEYDSWRTSPTYTGCPGCNEEVFTYTTSGTYTIYLKVRQVPENGGAYYESDTVTLKVTISRAKPKTLNSLCTINPAEIQLSFPLLLNSRLLQLPIFNKLLNLQ